MTSVLCVRSPAILPRVGAPSLDRPPSPPPRRPSHARPHGPTTHPTDHPRPANPPTHPLCPRSPASAQPTAAPDPAFRPRRTSSVGELDGSPRCPGCPPRQMPASRSTPPSVLARRRSSAGELHDASPLPRLPSSADATSPRQPTVRPLPPIRPRPANPLTHPLCPDRPPRQSPPPRPTLPSVHGRRAQAPSHAGRWGPSDVRRPSSRRSVGVLSRRPLRPRGSPRSS